MTGVWFPSTAPIAPDTASYWYQGTCPQTGMLLRLPRTLEVEQIARELMQQLAIDEPFSEGKMFGVLLVETPTGERQVLKAFSGLLYGQSTVDGWVPLIAGRAQVALQEANTLAQLEALKQELTRLQQMPERLQFVAQAQEFNAHLQQLAIDHAQRKQTRQQHRLHLHQALTGAALQSALAELDSQSQQDGIQKRRLKQQRDQQMQPLQQAIDQANTRIRELKQQRKRLSQQLQAQMHRAYCLSNFAGATAPLQQLMPNGLPTGTGDCCAPKLLNYAATHRLKPLAMAEFWWGSPAANGDKIAGEFYGACAERCQPLMGFLLSGLQPPTATQATLTLPIVHQDEWLIAVNKPAGLLSVPGRYGDRQDSVQSRLQHQLGGVILAAHRLDQDTSGILLLARDAATHRHLNQQFQQRQIHKVYAALLAGAVEPKQGEIELPLWGNPSDRPRQTVDWQQGKPSLTRFRVLEQIDGITRVELLPLTGRTHQLRVHAAHPAGLGVPILGDRLYGCGAAVDRLHLHAEQLTFQHPQTNNKIHLQATMPF